MNSGGLTQWTQSELGGLNPETFVEPELVEYETFDGRDIPAWVYEPQGEGPHPVIVYIHGGPEGQYRPGFSSTFQYWVNELDAAVIAPNVRGSAGYGKDYLKLDNGMKRKDSVKDIGALLDWIADEPAFDADRVVVYGGSYGGYMVLASAVDYSDRLAGAVDIVGVSNFVTFLENTEDYRRDLRRAEYGDERDPEMRKFLENIAPANNVNKITVPLFIIQGANDPRVPASESEQMLAAVRANETDAWYLLAKDEGHGFDKKSNQDYMREAVTVFLNNVLDTAKTDRTLR
jgi:dipeptidyl aminopeptidase/acylaminoacyl peptidase